MNRTTTALLAVVGAVLLVGHAPLAVAASPTGTLDGVNTSTTNDSTTLDTDTTVETETTVTNASTDEPTDTTVTSTASTVESPDLEATETVTDTVDETARVEGTVETSVESYQRVVDDETATPSARTDEQTSTDARARAGGDDASAGTNASANANATDFGREPRPSDSSAPALPASGVVFVGAVSAVGASATRSWCPTAQAVRTGVVSLRHAGLSEWGRRLLGLFGVHQHDEDPLAHDTRAAVYEHVASSPGTYLSEISEETDVPLPTVRYHLKVLHREGLVERTKVRGRRRYVPAGEEASALDAALADEAPAAVLHALADHGPDSVSGLASALDRDPSTVSHHLQRLEEEGLVERERDGQAVVNRLTPSVAAALGTGESVEASPDAAAASQD
ncbi:winged helix-turn-helix transcriptional regulator [Halospeciosus flavus]|uniref:Winged helix-turn-helix transcriptional regulator n=1 Tax=Halospeciosus flavus TaxID=3032283 RepID=A0ABD5Z4M2_9EURY|nr:metalloregulator ArsR/SmtB family transcription factor [Halospeciosus flavus]